MRTTINLDDEMMAKAAQYTGISERSTLVQRAIRELVEREASKRLAALGGTMPDFVAGPRKRYFDPV